MADNHILDLFDIGVPIIQAPMAGSAFSDMVVAVSQAGGLGSLACALLSLEQASKEVEAIRRIRLVTHDAAQQPSSSQPNRPRHRP